MQNVEFWDGLQIGVYAYTRIECQVHQLCAKKIRHPPPTGGKLSLQAELTFCIAYSTTLCFPERRPTERPKNFGDVDLLHDPMDDSRKIDERFGCYAFGSPC